MAKNKTDFTNADLIEFIQKFASLPLQIEDSLNRIEWMKKATGRNPKMWGPTTIGFEQYADTYTSGHSGTAPLLGYSHRKIAISLYILSSEENKTKLINKQGKYKIGKSCIYN